MLAERGQGCFFVQRYLLCLLLLAPTLSVTASPLDGHISPYLAMHADDPTQWQLWDKQSLAGANREKRLIFLSSGYFACHWCHVMQRESFRDEEIARILNRAFVPVKVDRELSPDLDGKLIDFARRTRGHAGWPLNVIITPDGYPLMAFVYLEPQRLKEVLLNIERRWQQDATHLSALAKQVAEKLSADPEIHVDPEPNGQGLSVEDLVMQVLEEGDELSGGFGRSSKFPDVPVLGMLLDLHAVSDDQALDEFLRTTLDSMKNRGLRDHIGGGFFRYTVDPDWSVPHFEKMLFDNAQLARLYIRAAGQLKDEGYREAAWDTLRFLLDQMRLQHGGFISSLSAVDQNGVEGGHYLWEDEAFDEILSDRVRSDFEQNWRPYSVVLDDGILLHGWEQDDAGHTAQSLLLQQARAMLQQAQSKRSLVPRDEKVLTAWNGLVLSALAAFVGERDGHELQQRVVMAGEGLKALLLSQMVNREGEPLRFLGQAQSPGLLEDYALLARGLLDWAAVTHDRPLLGQACRLAVAGWSQFYRKDGWLVLKEPLLRYQLSQPLLESGPLPASDAVLFRLLTVQPCQEMLSADQRTMIRQASTAWRYRVAVEPLRYPGMATLLLADVGRSE